MLLAPAVSPPPSFSPSTPSVEQRTVRAFSPRTIPLVVVPAPSPVRDVATNMALQEQEKVDPLGGIKCPSVVLDTPHITHTMAATLAISALGHILFLKSQVPFPVLQLSRMPCGQPGSRAAKRKSELLSAFDTLSSHLHTTFSALSTAFACSKTNGKKATRDAHLVFVFGPSVGAAKQRVVFVVDGLEVKMWGKGDEIRKLIQGNENSVRASRKDASQDENAEEEDEALGDASTDSDASSVESEEESEDELDGGSVDDDKSNVSEPPASRSPSPSPAPASLTPSHPSPLKKLTRSLVELAVPAAVSARAPIPQQPHTPTYGEQQQSLRAAERLLSRTLANACAEETGGMSCELAPTQMHVLLRAPRRFSHPAWVPRQNLTRTMDSVLQAFLDGVAPAAESPTKAKPKAAKGIKTEGVWLGCRNSTGVIGMDKGEAEADGMEEDEEDELIWWAWDGKIIGFVDW